VTHISNFKREWVRNKLPEGRSKTTKLLYLSWNLRPHDETADAGGSLEYRTTTENGGQQKATPQQHNKKQLFLFVLLGSQVSKGTALLLLLSNPAFIFLIIIQ
jgi:hypothetical protein